MQRHSPWWPTDCGIPSPGGLLGFECTIILKDVKDRPFQRSSLNLEFRIFVFNFFYTYRFYDDSYVFCILFFLVILALERQGRKRMK